MKKRVFLFLFLLTAFLSRSYADWGFSAQTVNGQWIMCVVVDETSHTVSVSKYDNSTSTSGNLVIPSTVSYYGQTYTVISIADYGFYNCSGLTSVTIPSAVTYIGDYAFSRCSGLTSVTISSAVTYIGDEAFSGCSGLATVNFNADSCTHMGSSSNSVFNGCSNLTTLNISNNVKSIPAYAFMNCSGLTSVTIENDNKVTLI